MKKYIILPVLALTLLGAGCLSNKTQDPEPEVIVDQEQQEPIALASPEQNDRVNSPLVIAGTIKTDVSGIRWNVLQNEEVLSEGDLLRETDTETSVTEFSERIFLPVLEDSDFTLRIWPMYGDRVGEEMTEVELRAATTEKTSVNIFFIDPDLQEFDCSELDFEKRTVLKTENVAELALQELIMGPTSDWALTSLPTGTQLENIKVSNGVATVEFSSPNISAWSGGSCHVASLRAQIERTLTQFPTISEVIISVNGETEEILQP